MARWWKWVTKSKWSSTVREAYPIDCQTFLTSIISDGKQAAKDIGDKVAEVGVDLQCVDEKVQVVIDGARGLFSQWLEPSNTHTSRQQTNKSCGAGNQIGNSTSCQ